MSEKAEQAQAEIVECSGENPQSLDEVVLGLRGFGIEDLENVLIITLKSGKKVRLRISNIPTNDEMAALLAVEGNKGYLWVKAVKIEILSRAISWIDGKSLRNLTPQQRMVVDPTDTVDEDGNPRQIIKDVQIVLRNLLKGWGQELVEVLWKVLMTHSQCIEDRLKASLPDSALMTETEARLFEQARAQIEAETEQVIQESVAKLYEPDEFPIEEKK